MTAMTHIETVTVGSGGAASIVFSDIPADFTDLLLQVSIRSSTIASVTGVTTFIRPNGATTNFSSRALYGSGSSAISFTATSLIFNNPSNYTASTFSSSEIYIPNYRSSAFKSFSANTVNENNGTTADMAIFAGLWSDTSAITSLSIVPEGGLLVEYSSASLFGITAGSSGGVVVS